MISIKPIKAYEKPGLITVCLLGEANARPEATTALPREVFDCLLALHLQPGKVESLKRVEAGTVYTELYALLPKDLDYDALEELSAELIKQLRALKADKVDILLGDEALKDLSGAFYKQLWLSADGFDRYQTSGIEPIDLKAQKKDKEAFAPAFTLYLPEACDLEKEGESCRLAGLYAEGIRTARALVNEPANVLTPERLAQEAVRLSRQHGFELEVFDERQIQDMGLEAFWSVAKGSDTPPRFIVMRYMNRPESQETLALVGKGLCYDSGGYAIKPAAGMDTMFSDMGGAAAVVGAVSALAAMKARVNVVGIVAACENMVSGHSYRNGDIIGSLSGKFIEVVNTDAEGRITLADAITYAVTVIKADKIIDIATLTGAVGIALGDQITGVVTDSEDIFQALQQASDQSGDKVWRLPHYEHLAKHNKSERADIKNLGGRLAGTATGALFCRAFAFGVPWAHLDIAGTAFQEKASAKAPMGATGVGAELLARAAIQLFEQ